MAKFELGDLEYHIYGRGLNQWEWAVWEANKSGKQLAGGSVKGARSKAVAEADAAIYRLCGMSKL